jgi:hypothetical protein
VAKHIEDYLVKQVLDKASNYWRNEDRSFWIR